MMASDWVSKMLLYLKRCSNVEIISFAEQKTFGKRFVEESIWREINMIRTDTLVSIINKEEVALSPSFVRMLRFLDMRVSQGEGPIEWASRIDEDADLAYLEKSQELMLMKFVHGLNDKLLNSKICKQDTNGCKETKALVRRYVASQTLQSSLEKKKADKGHIVNSLTGSRGPSPAPSPSQRRTSKRDSRGRSGDRRRYNS